MRLPPGRPANGLLISSILFPALIAATGNLDCSRIVIEGAFFDLSKLGGPHTVTEGNQTAHTWKNTTYTLDICQNLDKSRDIDNDKQCPGKTRGELDI
jgi:autophagy-related protein 27